MSKKIFFLLSLLVLIANCSNAATINSDALNERRFLFSSDVEEVEQPELDWNTIKYKTINVNVNEIEMTPAELYAKVQECIKKCQKTIKSDFSARDQCIAKTCDIY